MAVTTQNFNQLLATFAAGVQSAYKGLTNFASGTMLRAIGQATSACALWLQALLLQVLALTRAATSSGSDLDSFGADYGFTRLAATFAQGQATFSRNQTTMAALVPVGATAITADGTQTFTVIADTNNAAYSASQGGYPIAIGVASINATVQAQNAGSQGNIAAATLTQLGTGIPFVDAVTNGADYTNGIDAETDTAMRARFILFIAALSKGTEAAIESAIAGVQQGLSWSITENEDYPGPTADIGNFFVVVDDGTGSPSGTLIANVSNAIAATRACGVRWTVNGPNLVTLTVSMTIAVAAGYVKANIQPIVQQAILAYLNSLPLTTGGYTVPYTKLAQIAYEASGGITDVTNLLLNGGTADISISNIQVGRAVLSGITIN